MGEARQQADLAHDRRSGHLANASERLQRRDHRGGGGGLHGVVERLLEALEPGRGVIDFVPVIVVVLGVNILDEDKSEAVLKSFDLADD